MDSDLMFLSFIVPIVLGLIGIGSLFFIIRAAVLSALNAHADRERENRNLN